MIPFNRPSLAGAELQHMAAAVATGRISGDGEFTRRCHAVLEQELPGSRVLLTTSCTHALEMCALLLGLGPGDEVILPSFTFVSTANAFVLRGVTPVFADIRPDTLNLDESTIGPLVTARTRAIVPVHYAGVGCEMDTLAHTAAGHGLALVEDNAHGLFGRYRGRPLGTFGRLAALSFHETKNVMCGEGGALVINDPDLVTRAEILREKGTNRSQFFRREIDRYTWLDVGSSFLPSDLLAAFLYGQLEARAALQAKRHAIWARYARDLAAWAASEAVRLPVVPPHCDQPAHLFYLLLPSEAARTALVAHLTAAGVMAVSHYVPLHRSPMGLKAAPSARPCPVTDDVSARLLRLPIFPSLTEAEQGQVIRAITSSRLAA